MSHSPPFNYTDGVPVKISEKYKQPPEIQLTTTLTQKLLKTKKSPVAFVDYNFDLEHKIISKTTEWINWRLKEKTERQQRIQERELMRQKRFEHEQKVKLNQVSYPSAEDLSDENDEVAAATETIEATNSTGKSQYNSIPLEKVFSPNFNTILMPTQVSVNLSAADKKTHRRYASNSSNKIDFSFFESDASPFDNLEIKSMNEMEELAKVLQSATLTETEVGLERNNSSDSDPSSDQYKAAAVSPTNNNNNNDINESKVSIMESSVAENNPYSAHNFNTQQLYNNYYYGLPSVSNQSYYNTHLQQPQQNFGTATGTPTHQYSNSPYVINHQQLPNQCYYTQNYAVNHMNYAHALNTSGNNNNDMACENINSDKMDATVKSKSVPDLFKELNDELDNSERRRTRNISQCNQESHREDESEGKLQLFWQSKFSPPAIKYFPFSVII